MWKKLTTIKGLYQISAFLCFALLAFALYLEKMDALAPCPLCELQRACFLLIFGLSLLALLFKIGPKAIAWLSGTSLFFAIIGALLATHQLWLESHPPANPDVCGMDIMYMLKILPFLQVLKIALMGTGDCATVNWRLLGLSIPAWSLMAFIGLMGIAIYQLKKRVSIRSL